MIEKENVFIFLIRQYLIDISTIDSQKTLKTADLRQFIQKKEKYILNPVN